MNIWAVATLNKLFLKGFYTQCQFSKTRLVSGKFPLFMIGPFCTPHTICLNIVFLQDSPAWKFCNCTTKKTVQM